MHILQVTLGFFPALTWGGPVRVVHQNGRELVRRGHRVTVYCSNLQDKRHKLRPHTFEADIDGMRIVYFDTWRFKWWPGTLGPFWLPDLPAYLKREITSFDIVHLNGCRSPMMLAAARAARAAGVPFVSQPHGTIPVTSNSLWIKRIYDRILLRGEFEGLAALIASHEVERKQALSRGIADECITIIPNGIDPSERDAVPERGSFRRRHGLDPETPLILFLGRINKIKGTDMLVQAFARMKSAKARLAIAGPDDGQLTEVLALIRQYSLANRVILLGILPEVDKLAAFRDADLFVLPSRADSFPLAIMEACLMGTPMVITDRCAISDLVRDRVGEVVPFDADAFACAMERLLTDRALYERYRANAAVLFDENFSVRTVVDQLEELYNRVVAVLATAGGPRAASGYPKSYRR